MAAKKRTRYIREEDLVEVQRLHRMRYSQREIATIMGVTHQQVFYDLRVLLKRWQDKNYSDKDAEVKEILAEERWLKRQAREEYDRSRKPLTKTKGKRTTQGGKKGEADRVEVTNETDERLGDPRYLTIIEEANRSIRAIRGLDAPRQTVLTGGAEPVQVKIVEVIHEPANEIQARSEGETELQPASGSEQGVAKP
jgi:hypothetical protein